MEVRPFVVVQDRPFVTSFLRVIRRMVCIHRWEYLPGRTNPKNPKGTCRARLYDGSGGAASYLAQVLNASENKGWTESNVRIASQLATRR